MAALLKTNNVKFTQKIISTVNSGHIITRKSSVPPKKKPKVGTIKHRNLIKSTEESLASRGFLRSYKPYTPPEDVEEQTEQIISSVLKSNNNNEPLSSSDKFHLLNKCYQHFNHSVPNSMLNEMRTLRDVIQFYKTPVSTTTPYDELKSKDLPPNLHVIYDYVRFHPETDTMFGGITAFPQSSTIVTGLRYKKKYKGHTQPLPVYYDTWSDFIRHDAYDP